MAKYCSDTCGDLYRHLSTVTKECEYCKKMYDIYIHTGKTSKYCSYRCAGKGRNIDRAKNSIYNSITIDNIVSTGREQTSS